MTDLKLNEFHDLYVSESGATALESDYVRAARQRLTIKLQLFLGEWFLNTRLGVAYYRDVLIKNPNFSVIRVLMRSKILSDPDVADVPRLDLSLDATTRTLSVDFDAVLLNGAVVTVSYPPAVAGTPWDAPQLAPTVTPLSPAGPQLTPWKTDLRLTGTHDLYVGPTGSMELIGPLADAVKQRLAIKLQLFLGEWFLNLRLGFPYYRDVLIKNPNFSLIRTLIRNFILADSDVIAVTRLETSLSDRVLSVDFEAVIRDGTAITVSLPADSLPDDLVITLAGDPVVTLGGDYVVAS